MRKSLSLALLLAFALSACGRTNPFGGDGFTTPDGFTPPDGFNPPADFTSDAGPPPGDFGPPPPPPFDFGPPPPPPPFDFGPPPPPPFDFGPPPPPPDFGPPPPPPPPPTDGGPCVSGCPQRCALINQCGFVPPAACSALCPGFNASTRACLDLLVCSPSPFPNCGAVAQCFTSPPPPPPPFDGGPPPPPPFDGGPPPPPFDGFPPPPPFDGFPPPPPFDGFPPPPFDGGPPPPFRPDLVVQSFTASVTGSTVRYDLRVCNFGGSPATNFFVDVYYNRPSPPPTNDFGDDFQRFNRLGPGACVSSTFTRNNTPPGAYTSWAQVDADRNVAESNESNNIAAPLTVIVGGPPPPPIGPDLTIQAMTAAVSSSGTTVSYRIRVCNVGSVTSAPTQVHVYYDRASAPPAGQSGDKLTSVPALTAGACSDRLIARTGTPPGSYRSYAQVDPLNVVAEQNESNNTFGPVLVTVGTTPGADLTIQSFTAQVLGGAGTTVRYRIRVCNSGSGTSGATNVHVYYDRSSAPPSGAPGDQLTSVGQLSAGACSTRFITRSGTPPGSYASWAQVDVPSVVSETNENNNTSGPLAVTVGGPQNVDLIVTGFNAQAVGTTVSYGALVCNVGAQSSGATRFDLYFNRSTPPQPFNAGDRSQPIPSLAAGQCLPVAIARNNTPSGSYTSWARVDRFNQVAESNENNNVAGPTSVTVGSTTTSCSSICQRLAGPPCNLLPANQLPQCILACTSLPDSARVCASNALANGQCFQAIQCLLPVPGPIPLP